MYLLFPKWALRRMFDGLTQAIPKRTASLKRLTPVSPASFYLSRVPVFLGPWTTAHSLHHWTNETDVLCKFPHSVLLNLHCIAHCIFSPKPAWNEKPAIREKRCLSSTLLIPLDQQQLGINN